MERTGGREREGKGDKGIKRRKEEKVEQKGVWKAVFWNIAGVENKDKEFWQRAKRWDIIVMLET